MLPLVDGLRPLRDVMAQAKLVDFEVYEALHHLLEVGVIEVSLSAAPPKVTPLPTAAAPKATGRVGAGLALALGTLALALSSASVSMDAGRPGRCSATPPEAPAPPDRHRRRVRARGVAAETYRILRARRPPT